MIKHKLIKVLKKLKRKGLLVYFYVIDDCNFVASSINTTYRIKILGPKFIYLRVYDILNKRLEYHTAFLDLKDLKKHLKKNLKLDKDLKNI